MLIPFHSTMRGSHVKMNLNLVDQLELFEENSHLYLTDSENHLRLGPTGTDVL